MMKRRILLSLAALVTFVLSGLQSTAQQQICSGDTVCLTVQARGTVQWQHSTNQTTWTNIAGAIGDTACIPITASGWYRAQITEGTCDPIYSNTNQFNVVGGPGGSITYNFVGAVDTFIVPSCIDSIHIHATGAKGGSATNTPCDRGGPGGEAIGDLLVSGGDTLFIYVGEAGQPGNVGGWNGGGSCCTQTTTCAKGGGASDVRLNGSALSNRVIVAGGGGGAEWSSTTCPPNHWGGDGGGLTGGTGTHNTASQCGSGGTQTAGGTAGAHGTYPGQNGTLGVGGTSGMHPSGHGAGGGGGYYGGGGSAVDGNAGGGSSYIGGVNNGVTNAGVNSTGNGSIVLSW